MVGDGRFERPTFAPEAKEMTASLAWWPKKFAPDKRPYKHLE